MNTKNTQSPTPYPSAAAGAGNAGALLLESEPRIHRISESQAESSSSQRDISQQETGPSLVLSDPSIPRSTYDCYSRQITGAPNYTSIGIASGLPSKGLPGLLASASPQSGYPDNNPKTQFGLKKTAMHLVPPAAMRGLAEAFENGAGKYGPFNWREKKISVTVYYAATLRHLTDYYDRIDEGDVAPDSQVHHVKHAMACLAMILDTLDSPLLNDDRPIKVERT